MKPKLSDSGDVLITEIAELKRNKPPYWKLKVLARCNKLEWLTNGPAYEHVYQGTERLGRERGVTIRPIEDEDEDEE